MKYEKFLPTLFLAMAAGVGVPAENIPPSPKLIPRLQVIPLPYHQASFQRDGVELTRYHFGPGLHRPFLFPVIGPSGRSLTQIGHPHDPQSHSHHNSVWISHNDVNGTSFWSDGPREISTDKPLKLRYGLYAHNDMKSTDAVEAEWTRFTKIPASAHK